VAARVLLVTFQQALRSVVLSLLPITTLTLIAWALAGSQTGNTSDPLRASIWFWLGSHLIPFQLNLAPAFTSTFFNYLPIAAVILPFISLRSGFQRSAEELNNKRAARSFITLWYALIVTGAALLMQTETIKPIVYFAPIYAGAIALFATIDFKSEIFNNFRLFGNLVLIVLGISLLIIAFQLVSNFAIVKSLTMVVQPGWIGGLLLVFLELLYLPNLLVSVLAYICGFGFSIGNGTLVSPLVFKLNGIPAIPVLAALPSEIKKSALILALIPITALLLNQIRQVKGVTSIRIGLSNIVKSIWIFLPIALFIGYQSGGTFITKNLYPFGAKWWVLTAIFLLGQLLVSTFFYLAPVGIMKVARRSNV
jgi:hypothetical protein